MLASLSSRTRTLPRLCLAALVAASAFVLPAVAAPAALADGGPTPPAAAPVASIPFSSGDSFGGVEESPATDSANMAVARACNGDAAYYRPSWFKYTAPSTRKISASAATTVWLGRDSSDYVAGVAVLDVNLQVIDCAVTDGRAVVGPISVSAGASVYVVQFTGPAQCFDGICNYEYAENVQITAAQTWSFPINDNWRDASLVSALPFTQTVDTTFASEGGDEQYAAPANACSFLPDHLVGSVWWRFTPSTTGPLAISARGGAGAVVSYATLSADGPHYLPFECTADGQSPPDPVFHAGTTYMIAVGTAQGWYDRTSRGGGGPVTLTIGSGLALKKPDLVVTKVSTTPSAPKAGDPVQFSATIKNQGMVATSNGVAHGVVFKVGGVAVAFSDTFNAGLQPGASVTLTANGGPGGSPTWAALTGVHTVQAVVDDINRIPGESSESNNTLSRPLTVATGVSRPDVVVTAVSWTPVTPAAGMTARFAATIKNQGSAPTPAGVVNAVRFSVDGVTKNWSDTYKSSLAPGSSVTLTANSGPTGSATWTTTSGPHTIKALVDDVNHIVESNESNNDKSAPMSVGTLGNRADLVVTNVTWSPPSLAVNIPSRFSATVKNVGTRSTPNSTVVGVSFRINGSTAGATWSDTSRSQLLPGESVTVTANGGATSGTWRPGLAGQSAVTAVVDDVNRIPETNEGNNQLTSVLKVG